MSDASQPLFSLDEGLDQAFVNVLLKALATTDKSSFSYLKFREAVLKLMEKGLSERDAVESVFTTAETLGTPRASLITSAGKHVETLEREHQNFEAAREKKLTDGMAADRTKLEKLDTQEAKLRAQLAAIEEKLAAAATKRAEITKHLATTKARVEERGAAFDAAYRALRQHVESDVLRMREHDA